MSKNKHYLASALTDSLGLLAEHLLAGDVGLTLVNVFHQETLVLEDVTLGAEVKLVVAGEEIIKKRDKRHHELA